MVSRQRILFLYAKTGAGHRAGALAVAEALQQRHGAEVDISSCDGLQALGLWPFDHFAQWWPAMLKLGGIPWGVFYRWTNHPIIPAALARLLLPMTVSRVAALLAMHSPKVIVSFHPLYTHTVTAVLRGMSRPVPFVSVVLDLVSIHAAWCSPSCSQVFVPTPQAAMRVLGWGLAPERVTCTGLPVAAHFVTATHLEPVAARARLGLPLHGPMVLATGGGDASGPLLEVVRLLAAKVPHINLVVITGNNVSLRRDLIRANLDVRVEGFVENMELWMRAADILLTKAGPNTMAEAMVMGLPSVLYHAIPGQETGNVQWAISHGAALWAPRPSEATEAIITLLSDKPRRNDMSEAALKLARPNAAIAVGEGVWQLIA